MYKRILSFPPTLTSALLAVGVAAQLAKLYAGAELNTPASREPFLYSMVT